MSNYVPKEVRIPKLSFLVLHVPTPASLFINKRFALNEMFQRNASKLAIFYVIEYCV